MSPRGSDVSRGNNGKGKQLRSTRAIQHKGEKQEKAGEREDRDKEREKQPMDVELYTVARNQADPQPLQMKGGKAAASNAIRARRLEQILTYLKAIHLN